MKKYLLAIGATLLASSVMAQSTFEGFYGQVGIGYQNLKHPYSSNGLSLTGVSGLTPLSGSFDNASGFAATLGAGYLHAFSKDFLLGIGAEFNPITSGNTNFTLTAAGYPLAQGTYKSKNFYNIFLSPATPIGTAGLLYAKVGYTGIQIDASTSGISNTHNFNGYSLGLGYKQVINAGLYGFVEVNYLNYSNNNNSRAGAGYSYTSTTSLNGYNALAGIGYKF
jgi:outer membrane immunogenic protein